MSTVTIDIERPIERVWSGVVDAEGYPDWLVGAQNVDVPDLWPECGESFHHRVGFGPFQMPGSTTSVDVAEPSFFHIRAGVGPFGEADVTFELESISPDTTRVTMTEKPTDGVIDVIGRLADHSSSERFGSETPSPSPNSDTFSKARRERLADFSPSDRLGAALADPRSMDALHHEGDVVGPPSGTRSAIR